MRRNSVGTGKSISFELFDDLQEQWCCLTRMSPHATLYHSEEWIKVLRLTYGFCFRAAILECQGVAEAGVLLAGVRRPVARWWVALPFSDACPPLAVDGCAETALLSQLQEFCGAERFEIRGMPAPWRWQSADCFLSWELDLSKAPNQLYGTLENNFRRNLNKARKMGIGITHGNEPELVERFYRLHARSRRRLGLPCQSLRFFRIVKQVLKNEVDVWLASRNGRDIGAIFLIGHGDTLLFKWSARDPNETSGAIHLLAWSLIEHWPADSVDSTLEGPIFEMLV